MYGRMFLPTFIHGGEGSQFDSIVFEHSFFRISVSARPISDLKRKDQGLVDEGIDGIYETRGFLVL